MQRTLLMINCSPSSPPISLEHTEFLGDNLVSIAIEKAGNYGGKMLWLFLARQEPEVVEALQEISPDIEFADESNAKLGLSGDFQKINAAHSRACCAEIGD